eukprot:3235836-Pyramimonas_sp.AAC.1
MSFRSRATTRSPLRATPIQDESARVGFEPRSSRATSAPSGFRVLGFEYAPVHEEVRAEGGCGREDCHTHDLRAHARSSSRVVS